MISTPHTRTRLGNPSALTPSMAEGRHGVLSPPRDPPPPQIPWIPAPQSEVRPVAVVTTVPHQVTGTSADLALSMQRHTAECPCRYTLSQLQICGKKCDKVVWVYLSPSSGIFYPLESAMRAGPNRVGPVPFIQNTKLGFYVQKGDAVVEYFRDWYEAGTSTSTCTATGW